MGKLTGKHIVVTGASAGIGKLLSQRLGALGCRVTLAARRLDKLDELAAEIEAGPGQAFAAQCDVTRREEVLDLAKAARGHFGEIDIWVSNAGAGTRHGLLEATEDDMLAMYRLNCLSSLWGYQAVVPGWLEQGCGGQLMDVNSVGGLAGFAYNGGYCAAKHAMSGMGDVLRQELLGKEITLTTVYPGLTESDFSDAVTDRTGGDHSKRTTAMSRRGNFLVRKVSRKQSTEDVVAAMIRGMERPRCHVYPHRWAAFAGFLYRLNPELVLGLMARSRRR